MAGNDFDDPDGFFDRVLKSTSGQSQFWARRSFWGAILMSFAVIALVSVIWLSYVSGPDATDENNLPLIEASDNPYRETPENPGGLDIDNQDSVIFEAMRGEDDAGEIENLLEDEEQPSRDIVLEEGGMDVAEDDGEALTDEEIAMLKARLDAKRSGTSVDDILISENASTTDETEVVGLPERGEFAESDTPKEAPEETLAYVRSVLDKKDLKVDAPETDSLKAVETTAPTPVIEAEPEVKPEPTPAPTPVVKEEPKPVTTASVSTSTGTGPDRYIQLGSFKDRESAMSLWSSMNKDFPNLFDELTLRVQEADLGDKGIYYRAQAGVVPETKAREICAAILAKKPGGCLVAKP